MLRGSCSWADEEIAGSDERRGKERVDAGGGFYDNALRRMTLATRPGSEGLRGGGWRARLSCCPLTTRPASLSSLNARRDRLFFSSFRQASLFSLSRPH